MLDGLSPTMRALALEMAGKRGAAAVRVIRPGAFEIVDPAAVPGA